MLSDFDKKIKNILIEYFLKEQEIKNKKPKIPLLIEPNLKKKI
jgi:hypothetical protein